MLKILYKRFRVVSRTKINTRFQTNNFKILNNLEEIENSLKENQRLIDASKLAPKSNVKTSTSKIFSQALMISCFLLGTFAASLAFGYFFNIYSFFKAQKEKIMDSNREKLPKFDDVCGNDEIKEELADIVTFLQNPQKFSRMKAKVPKGVLISGHPGCGKTLMAKAMAGESRVSFLYASGSSFEQMFVGLGAKRIRKLFDTAKKIKPCIIFIDEIDAVGEKRNSLMSYRTSINQLLTEMDGFDQNDQIIVVGATNLPEKLEPALTRSGRFDRNVSVTLPDKVSRKKMLDLNLKNKPISEDINTEKIASEISGFSGADIANLVNIAAIEVAKAKGEKITSSDLRQAISTLSIGRPRRSAVLSPQIKRLTAYHEAGHAIANIYGARPSRVSQITILPRGDSLGATYRTEKEDSQFQVTLEELLSQIDICMGGYVAEELLMGSEKVTTGPSSDLQRATEIASKMVMDFGLLPGMGKMALGAKAFPELPPKFQKIANCEIKRVLNESKERTKKIICENWKSFEKLAEELLLKETLSGEEIRKILGGEVNN